MSVLTSNLLSSHGPRKRAEWNSDIVDPDRYRLTKEEILRRRASAISPHAARAREEYRKKMERLRKKAEEHGGEGSPARAETVGQPTAVNMDDLEGSTTRVRISTRLGQSHQMKLENSMSYQDVQNEHQPSAVHHFPYEHEKSAPVHNANQQPYHSHYEHQHLHQNQCSSYSGEIDNSLVINVQNADVYYHVPQSFYGFQNPLPPVDTPHVQIQQIDPTYQNFHYESENNGQADQLHHIEDGNQTPLYKGMDAERPLPSSHKFVELGSGFGNFRARHHHSVLDQNGLHIIAPMKSQPPSIDSNPILSPEVRTQTPASISPPPPVMFNNDGHKLIHFPSNQGPLTAIPHMNERTAPPALVPLQTANLAPHLVLPETHANVATQFIEIEKDKIIGRRPFLRTNGVEPNYNL